MRKQLQVRLKASSTSGNNVLGGGGPYTYQENSSWRQGSKGNVLIGIETPPLLALNSGCGYVQISSTEARDKSIGLDFPGQECCQIKKKGRSQNQRLEWICFSYKSAPYQTRNLSRGEGGGPPHTDC